MSYFFQILSNVPNEKQKGEDDEKKAVKATYGILAELFAVDRSRELRENTIKNNFIARILDRVATISRETKRKWEEEESEEEDEDKSEKPTTTES